jgi:hypothetical protein
MNTHLGEPDSDGRHNLGRETGILMYISISVGLG